MYSRLPINVQNMVMAFATIVAISSATFRPRRVVGGNNIAASFDLKNCYFIVNLSDVSSRPIIQSPNYPGNYWPNLHCRWLVTANFGYRIQLVFDTFIVQPAHYRSGCHSEYLQIDDLSGTKRYCGTDTPIGSSYLSVGPKLQLIFVSDRMWEYPGFSIRAKLAKISCGGYAINPSPGVIRSPNNPKAYPPDTLCAWTIQVSENRSVRLNCSASFAIEYSEGCLNDFLIISEDGDDTMTNVSRFCGKTGPRTIISRGTKLNVMFKSNSWHNFAGFFCKYQITGETDSTSNDTNNIVSGQKCDCGRLKRRQKRIVGGELITTSLPWLVALTSRQGQLFCGGVLVAPNYVLTAGHCLNGLSADNISVAIENYRPQWWASNHLIPVERIVVHPRLKRFDYDAALLEIPSKLPHDSERKCICLPRVDLNLLGRKAQVYGWGRDVTNRDDRLRKVSVPIHNDTSCRKIFAKLIQITPRMICAGEDGKDACEGDSGGPLILQQDNRQTVVGLVSFGLGCGAPGYPGVYTKISQLVKWIRDTAQIKCE